jgi:hypothetical protein
MSQMSQMSQAPKISSGAPESAPMPPPAAEAPPTWYEYEERAAIVEEGADFTMWAARETRRAAMRHAWG